MTAQALPVPTRATPAENAARTHTRVVQCRAATTALWPWVAHTERLNRGMGLARVEATPLEGAGAARFLARTWTAGVKVTFEEQPFEWLVGRHFGVRRVFHGGPFSLFALRVTFEARESGGTDVRVEVQFTPRNRLLAPLAALAAREGTRRFAAAIRRVDAALATDNAPALDRAPSPTANPALERALQGLRATSPPAHAPLIERLAREVREGADFELSELRPYALAEQWGARRRDVLALCLHAVVAGMLELRWQLICPSCLLGTTSVPNLAELPADGHCALCDLRFGLDLDESVEVLFRPATAIRAVDAGPYCLGGPARMPHVALQVVLEPGQEHTLVPDVPLGEYRLFMRGGHRARLSVRNGGATLARLVASEADLTPAQIVLAPGGRLIVESRLESARHLKLEHPGGRRHAATAFAVSTLPALRQLFSAEVLRPGVTLGVRRAGLLFSDLSASTEMYARAGDAKAYAFVQDHFDLATRILHAHDGALVKTIGDAVMAVFEDDAALVRAACALQRAFSVFRAGRPEADGVYLRLGACAGPVFAATANGQLDYFGQTVNTAARLQSLAAPGEIVLGESLHPAMAGALGEDAHISAGEHVSVKGLATPQHIVRVRVS